MEVAQIGHSVLASKAQIVQFPLSLELQQFLDQMLDTLKDKNGVGIAAPQLFKSEQIIIVASAPNKRYPKAPVIGPIVMINPEILEFSNQLESDWEGCLSVPGMRALVPRSKTIKLRFQNITGETFTEEYQDFVARIIQHEVDHLNGISFLERVEDKKSFMTEASYQQIIQEQAKAL